MEWKRIEDGLPDKDIPVLTFDGKYIAIMEYWYDVDNRPIFIDPGMGSGNGVIYWMPLPSPPKSEG